MHSPRLLKTLPSSSLGRSQEAQIALKGFLYQHQRGLRGVKRIIGQKKPVYKKLRRAFSFFFSNKINKIVILRIRLIKENSFTQISDSWETLYSTSCFVFFRNLGFLFGVSSGHHMEDWRCHVSDGLKGNKGPRLNIELYAKLSCSSFFGR